MIRVLVVDDDREKRRAISEAIATSSSAAVCEVHHATDVIDAKRSLSSSGFDLLLLDLNLPRRSELAPEMDGGLEILRWFKTRGSNYRPSYIVCLTEYEEALQLGVAEFDNLIWRFIHFSHRNNEWRSQLGATLALIVEQSTPPFQSDGRTYRTDVAVVTALRDPELTELLKLSDSWAEVRVRHDASNYFQTDLDVGGRKIGVVAVAASDKGLPGAGIAATKMIYSFRPRYLAMVGICAGLEGRVALGDVVVADPTWDWGSGKIKLDDAGQEFFHPASYQLRLDETIRAKAEILDRDEEWKRKVFSDYKEKTPGVVFSAKVGATASGASVLQSAGAVKRVLDQHKDLRAIEMEIFSVMFAAHLAPAPRPTAFALKGVCDFGDSNKGDTYQQYAAYTSAQTFYRLLAEIVKDWGEDPS